MARAGFALLVFIFSARMSAAAASKPNLVLITIDSARADHMGLLGAKSNLTPNLNRLTTESIVFDHAYTQAPGTVVSHATILSGSYPQTTGMTEIGGTLAPSLPNLPELLKAQGYRTAAFVGSIALDPSNGLAQGFDRGFQTYDAGFRPVIVGTGAVHPVRSSALMITRSGAEVVSRAATWLSKNTQGPFFIWIHIADADSAQASYNTAISAADAAVGKFLAALKAHQLDGATAVIVAADHGQSLGAHGENTHSIFLYDETIRVPLLVKLPAGPSEPKQTTASPANAKPAAPVTTKVRLLDIAPTLLEIAGIPVPSQMQGQSLLRIAKSGAADQPVYSRSDFPQRAFGWSPLESWRAGKYLYIRAPKAELYDLIADPSATHNLAQSSKATLDTMAAQLESFDRRFSGQSAKASSELTSSEMQKLASLGYVGLQKSSSASAPVAGIDPKDKIATANKILDAAPSVLAPSKPDRAIASLTPLVASDSSLYLAEYALGVALAQKAQTEKTQSTQKAQYADAVEHLHRAIELQPDSAWAHYEIGATLLQLASRLQSADSQPVAEHSSPVGSLNTAEHSYAAAADSQSAAEDYKIAAIHLEIAAGRLPAFAPAHAALAEAYEHLGRADDAKRERTRAQ